MCRTIALSDDAELQLQTLRERDRGASRQDIIERLISDELQRVRGLPQKNGRPPKPMPLQLLRTNGRTK